MGEARYSVRRDDLERLASAATAFCALQRVAEHAGQRMPDIEATIDGKRQVLTAATLHDELGDLEQTVIRVRRMLGWRR